MILPDTDNFRGGKGFMSEDVFERALTQQKEIRDPHVIFSPPVGDPLVDPKIIHRVKRTKDEQLFIAGNKLNADEK